MTDDIIEGPDPNEVRRHAKKMFSAAEYNRKYRRIDYYRPNAKQFEAHNTIAQQLCLRAGNQLGKTTWGAAQMSLDALGWYPEWYRGRKFLTPPPIERPEAFRGWVGGLTSTATREGPQLKLIGNITQDGGLGTGLIPLDNIVSVSRSRGIDAFADTIVVRREIGGDAIINVKTFEQGPALWQGSPVDEIWLDEDVGFGPNVAIWPNSLARFNSTDGRLIWTASPRLGLGVTPWRQKFRVGDPNCAEVLMGLDDVDHISAEGKAKLIAQYAGNRNRGTVLYGADPMGSGNVYEFPVERITHNRHPSTFPNYWPWCAAIDFSHGGVSDQAHPFAWMLAVVDPAADVIYVTHCFRLKGMHSSQHIARIKENPMWDSLTLFPHDGSQSGGEGQTLAGLYKKGGLNMNPAGHTTFPQGGYSLEAGISAVRERLANGKLLFPAHEVELLDEYSNYSYNENGKPADGQPDDLLSCVRQIVMGRRYFREMKPDANAGYRSSRSSANLNTPQAIAKRCDYDLWNPTGGE